MTQGCLLSSITRAGRAPSALALLAPVNSLAHEPKESVIDSGPFAEYASAHDDVTDVESDSGESDSDSDSSDSDSSDGDGDGDGEEEPSSEY